MTVHTCLEHCFVAAIELQDEKIRINHNCTGCGMCTRYCPHGAISLTMENEDAMLRQLLDRVQEICELPLQRLADEPRLKIE